MVERSFPWLGKMSAVVEEPRMQAHTNLQVVHFAVLALLLKDFEQALRSGRETGYKVENRNITISPITTTIQSSKKPRHPIGA